jgi:ABC-type multidrug transport system fused ATPase/permease subunit
VKATKMPSVIVPDSTALTPKNRIIIVPISLKPITNGVYDEPIRIALIVAFTEYQFAYFMPLVDLVTMYDQYQSAMSAIERMFDVIDTKVEIVDAPPERRVMVQ